MNPTYLYVVKSMYFNSLKKKVFWTETYVWLKYIWNTQASASFLSKANFPS